MTSQTTKPRPAEREAAYQNAHLQYNTHETISEFHQAMQAAGIHYSGEIIPDGNLHRFHIEGHKSGSLNGAYVLHLDDCPAGWFKDFTSGISKTWRSGNGSKVSYALVAQIKEAKQQREAETRQKHEAAARKAAEIWRKSRPVNNQAEHPYLAKKRIQPHGARLFHESLVIPIHNEADRLVNIQFIDSESTKRFLSGGRKRGCFHIFGDPTKRILICEGYATGASLYEDCKQRVIVAFDAGNLLPERRISAIYHLITKSLFAGTMIYQALDRRRRKKRR